MFYVLIGGPLGDTVVNTHQSTHLKWVHFTVCRLSLNKADFQGKKIGKKKEPETRAGFHSRGSIAGKSNPQQQKSE